MGSRLELHSELLKFLPNVYFQPPSNIQMVYPCIVYSKNDNHRRYAGDNIYRNLQGYQLMVIDRNPDSNVADEIEKSFQHCSISRYYIVDNLNHTTLNLFY